MTTRHRKKSRHVRGTHWTGTRTKRGAGNRGGRGRAGTGKRAGHRKDMFLGQIGKHGFRSVKQRHNFHPTAINVDQLDQLSNALVSKGLAKKTPEGIELDLSKLGYGKLIGKGLVKHKLIVFVPLVTESAKSKVEEAGGKIIQD